MSDWFLIQGPDLTWSDFMAANLVRQDCFPLCQIIPAAVAFPYKTAIKDYKPPRMTPFALDRSEQAVKEIMAAAGFGITEFYFCSPAVA